MSFGGFLEFAWNADRESEAMTQKRVCSWCEFLRFLGMVMLRVFYIDDSFCSFIYTI